MEEGLEKIEAVRSKLSGMGQVVEFGQPGEGGGMAMGVEVELDITEPVRNIFSRNLIKIPQNVTKIVYLDLAPQEALPPDERTIRSKFKPKSFLAGSALVTVTSPKVERPRLENF